MWIDWKIASDNTFGANTEYVGSTPAASTQGDVGNVLLQIKHPKKTVDNVTQMCYTKCIKRKER